MKITPALLLLALALPAAAQNWQVSDGPRADVNQSGDPTDSAPSMVLDASGNPVIVWVFENILNREVLLKRWNGSAWEGLGESATGDDFRAGISRTDSHDSVSPRVALEASGNPVVVWTEYVTVDNDDWPRVYLRRWNGTTWEELGGSATGKGLGDAESYASQPSLAIDALGRIIVAWIDFNVTQEVYVRRWNGNAWEELGASATEGGLSASDHAQLPSVAVDSMNRPVVAWQDSVSGNAEILLRRWNGSAWEELGGSATGGGLSATVGGSSQPVVKIGPLDRPAVAWREVVATNREIYFRGWTGSAWEELGGSGSSGGLSSSAGLSSDPCLAIDEIGRPVVAWTEKLNTTLWSVQLRRWTGAAWVELGGSAGDQGIDNRETGKLPSLALDPSGNPIAAWEWNPTGGQYMISLSRWRNDSPTLEAGQYREDQMTPLPHGGFTYGETEFALRGSSTDPENNATALVLELRESGEPFKGIPTHQSTFSTNPPLLAVPGLVLGTGYRWQARAVDAYGALSPWIRMAGASDDVSVADLIARVNTAPDMDTFEQVDGAGDVIPRAARRVMPGRFFVRATAVDGEDDALRFEVEVRPADVAFTGVATATGAFVPSGAVATVEVPVGEGACHWQIRAIDVGDDASTWAEGADFVADAYGSLNSHCGSTAGAGIALAAVAAMLGFMLRR